MHPRVLNPALPAADHAGPGPASVPPSLPVLCTSRTHCLPCLLDSVMENGRRWRTAVRRPGWDAGYCLLCCGSVGMINAARWRASHVFMGITAATPTYRSIDRIAGLDEAKVRQVPPSCVLRSQFSSRSASGHHGGTRPGGCVSLPLDFRFEPSIKRASFGQHSRGFVEDTGRHGFEGQNNTAGLRCMLADAAPPRDHGLPSRVPQTSTVPVPQHVSSYPARVCGMQLRLVGGRGRIAAPEKQLPPLHKGRSSERGGEPG